MYRLCNIFRVIKSDRLGWGGHVARMEEVRSIIKISAAKKIYSKEIFRKPLVKVRIFLLNMNKLFYTDGSGSTYNAF